MIEMFAVLILLKYIRIYVYVCLGVLIIFRFPLAPNTKDLDVFLRKQESGFGFRVLGGDGPDQSVSLNALEFGHFC